jgi:hypothetical protein
VTSWVALKINLTISNSLPEGFLGSHNGSQLQWRCPAALHKVNGSLSHNQSRCTIEHVAQQRSSRFQTYRTAEKVFYVILISRWLTAASVGPEVFAHGPQRP